MKSQQPQNGLKAMLLISCIVSIAYCDWMNTRTSPITITENSYIELRDYILNIQSIYAGYGKISGTALIYRKNKIFILSNDSLQIHLPRLTSLS